VCPLTTLPNSLGCCAVWLVLFFSINTVFICMYVLQCKRELLGDKMFYTCLRLEGKDTCFFFFIYLLFTLPHGMTACSRPGPSQSHSRYTTFSRDFSGWVISPTQNPVSDNTQHSERDIFAFSGIWSHNPRKWAAADPCLTLTWRLGLARIFL